MSATDQSVRVRVRVYYARACKASEASLFVLRFRVAFSVAAHVPDSRPHPTPSKKNRGVLLPASCSRPVDSS